MKITPKQYAIGLYESTNNLPEAELAKRIKNFVGILKKNNDFSLEKKIVQQYYKYHRTKRNISKIEITSSQKLNSETLNNILEKFSKQVEIEEKIDRSLIGGIVIKIDENTLVDGSVKRKLEDLRKNIL